MHACVCVEDIMPLWAIGENNGASLSAYSTLIVEGKQVATLAISPEA
jgi:hypothetical protein